MDILAHCKVYQLSTFYRPAIRYIDLSIDGIANELSRPPSTNIHELAYVHLIEHSFKISSFKQKLLLNAADLNGDTESTVLVIDLISVWQKFLVQNNLNMYYLSSVEILDLNGLISYLSQLNESPLEALNKCQLKGSRKSQLKGILIDNLSYLTQDASDSSSLYNVLFKTFKMLRKTFGCWIISTSYGIEFYDGVENGLSYINRGGTLTRLPISYVSEMDAVLLRNNDTSARFCQF